MTMVKKKISIVPLFGIGCFILASCGAKEYDAKVIARQAPIFPDYTEVTMPCNIAAPTFSLKDSLLHISDAQAIFKAGEQEIIVKSDGDRGMCIDEDDWKSLVDNSKGKIEVRIQGKVDGSVSKTADEKAGETIEYKSFNIYISKDSVDRYLSYRLIEPGYEVWNEMGIYQRDLESYDEKAILTNKSSDGGCVNCHSFCNRDASTMSLHLRLEHGGTYILKQGKATKLSPKPSFVYPSWHPDGRYIAYSHNETKQRFHTTDHNRIEVFDFKSDVIVYDTEADSVLTCPLLHSPLKFETFPSWSSDGKTLYFCSTDSVDIPADYDKAHYSLCSISFDDKTGTFGDKVDTLYNARINGGSASFPRESPDGRWMLFTHHAYGNFSIWHQDADLWMIDLKSQTESSYTSTPCTVLNSKSVDSYHSWSSTGRWVVLSSRRDDGLYTRPYIAHCSADGKFSKPFPLPQQSADYTIKLLKSYNIPEFTVNAFTDDDILRETVNKE